MPCTAPVTPKGLLKVASMTHGWYLISKMASSLLVHACWQPISSVTPLRLLKLSASLSRDLWSKWTHDRPLLSHVRWAFLNCYLCSGSKWSHLGGTQQSLAAMVWTWSGLHRLISWVLGLILWCYFEVYGSFRRRGIGNGSRWPGKGLWFLFLAQ